MGWQTQQRNLFPLLIAATYTCLLCGNLTTWREVDSALHYYSDWIFLCHIRRAFDDILTMGLKVQRYLRSKDKIVEKNFSVH